MFCYHLRAAFMTKMMLIGESAYKFNIWDTAGQERVYDYYINIIKIYKYTAKL